MASGKNKSPREDQPRTNKVGKFLRHYALWAFIPIPAILGMIGFCSSGGGFWNSAYSCLTMYFMEYGDPTDNVWIQVARWLAPVATASGLTMVFTSASRWVKQLFARCSKKSVAVFGPDFEKTELLRELGIYGISMDSSAVRAGSYVLMGNEDDNLEFYQQNAAVLKGKDVYLKCCALPEQVSSDPQLHLYSPEETAARLFWKENCPIKLSQEANHHLKIAIFGFGRLGRELLLQGLQYNIFSSNQVIEYHVFGDDEGFTDTHPQLTEITDPVVFHSEPWYKAQELLQGCHMKIVVQQEEQLELLQGLSSLFPQATIHVFAAQISGILLLMQNTGIECFDWKAKSMLLESIRGTKTHYLAKKLNLRYSHLYSGIPENDDNMESEWLKLDAFTRYSNISSANYHDVCMQILDGANLTEECLAFLGELEHIRWCRYHYLNNWQYGVPESGKVKDPQKRIHKLLIPNDQLDELEQEKDRENVRILMDLQ